MGRRVITLTLSTALACAAATIALAQSAPATAPTTAPAGVDEALWREMGAIDARSSQVTDLTARFEQHKHTPLLRRPLVSSGTIIARGDISLWTTEKPEPAAMLVGPSEIRLHYPEQRVMEIYPVDQDLGALAASPLPRLDVLRRFFTFERLPVAELGEDATDARHLAVRLTPVDEQLAEHVDEVRVLLDRESGFVLRAETIDADGDRTVITFTDVRTGEVTDEQLTLDPPPGTSVSRPLDGLAE